MKMDKNIIKSVTPPPPRRKSMAGPALLSSYTTPGAIRKSIIASQRNKVSEEETVPFVQQPKEAKDITIIEGNINIRQSIDMGKDMLCCKYNENFEYLAVGCCDGVINLYKSGTNNFYLNLVDDEIKKSVRNPVTSIKHRPVSKNYPINNCFTCTYTSGYVKCWNYNFKQCIYTIRENRQTYGINYHPRLPKFVTYGDDLKIYLYDEESKVQERILTGSTNPKTHDGPRSRVFAACFNPRSNHELITGGWDNLIHFWDLRQPHSIRQISGMHICGESLDINTKGTEILICAYQAEKPFQIWDYATAKLIQIVESDQYNSKLYAGKFVAGGTYVGNGGCEPNLFRLVDMEKNVNIGAVIDLPGGVYSVDLGAISKNKRALPQAAFIAGKRVYQIEFY